MRCFVVVQREFRSRGNDSASVNLDGQSPDAEITIGPATVIEKAEGQALGAIQRATAIQLDQINFPLLRDFEPGLFCADQWAVNFSNFPASREVTTGKETQLMNVAGGRVEDESFRQRWAMIFHGKRMDAGW
jgi:hypothetical protein